MNSLRMRLAAARRTPAAFRNWPAVLTSVAWSLISGYPRVLRIRTFSGTRLHCPNTPWSRGALWEVFVDDCYRLGWFLDSKRIPRALDIGAHVGSFALRLAELCPQVMVECYEPSPIALRFLRENVSINDRADQVHVNGQAVAGTSGFVELRDDGNASVENTIVQPSSSEFGVVSVPSVPLADILANASPPFDLVKIDCEGAEYEAVRSTPPEAWRGVSQVVIEYHPVDDRGWAELAASFAAAGFTEADHVRDTPRKGFGTVWLVHQPRRPSEAV